MRSTVMLLMLALANGLVTTPLRMHQTYQPTTRPFLPASRHHAALMQSAELHERGTPAQLAVARLAVNPNLLTLEIESMPYHSQP